MARPAIGGNRRSKNEVERYTVPPIKTANLPSFLKRVFLGIVSGMYDYRRGKKRGSVCRLAGQFVRSVLKRARGSAAFP